MRVLIELRATPQLGAALTGAAVAPADTAATDLQAAGLELDASYPPVELPAAQALGGNGHALSMGGPMTFSAEPMDMTYLVRGEIPDGSQTAVLTAAHDHPEVVQIHSDPQIETCIVCPGDPAVGDDADVARLLEADLLAQEGMTGEGVDVAVVDTGINLQHLRDKGRDPNLDAAKSFSPSGVSTQPGAHPVDHGTMCAYDVGIAAPDATLLDHAVLLSQRPGRTAMEGLLSDALLSYASLRRTLLAQPAAERALVVSNSWGMFDPAWDFPPGQPGNYSDNPQHPFNLTVGSLEAAGADILFAAGNCGRNCPDGRCNFGNTRPICGANSHPSVLSVAGIDTTRKRVGYSSQGPGRLAAQKPDLAVYTHFVGSGVYPEDGGTSAACPVLAGVVAAVRTRYRSQRLAPQHLRWLLFRTSVDLGRRGFDYDYGWGTVGTQALLDALAQVPQEEAAA